MSGFVGDPSLHETPVLVSHDGSEKWFGVANSSFVLGIENDAFALTDRGTTIPLFRYEALITSEADGQHQFDPDRDLNAFLSKLEELYLAKVVPPHCSLQRVRELNPRSNCHGWTFAGGQYGIHAQHVPLILREHHYFPVQEPKYGDLAVYYWNDTIVHSGFVRLTVPGHEILVESKWGPFGVFLHTLEAHQGVCSFYRTARHSDNLNIVRRGK